jgi:hypothetical protein
VRSTEKPHSLPILRRKRSQVAVRVEREEVRCIYQERTREDHCIKGANTPLVAEPSKKLLDLGFNIYPWERCEDYSLPDIPAHFRQFLRCGIFADDSKCVLAFRLNDYRNHPSTRRTSLKSSNGFRPRGIDIPEVRRNQPIRVSKCYHRLRSISRISSAIRLSAQRPRLCNSSKRFGQPTLPGFATVPLPAGEPFKCSRLRTYALRLNARLRASASICSNSFLLNRTTRVAVIKRPYYTDSPQ